MRILIDEAEKRAHAAAPGGSGIRIGYRLFFEGRPLFPSFLSANASTVRAVYEEAGDRIAEIEDVFSSSAGLISVERRWLLRRAGPWTLCADLSMPGESSDAIRTRLRDGHAELLIPAVWYRGNSRGTGAFPRSSVSDSWSFLETRTPLPGCVCIGGGRTMICAVSPSAVYERLSSARGSVEGSGAVEFEIPGRESPFSYTGKTSLDPASEQDPGGLVFALAELPVSYSRTFYCMADARRPVSLYGAYRAFAEALSLEGFGERPCRSESNSVSWMDYRVLKLSHLLSLVERAPDGSGAYLAMGRRNGELQDVYEYTAGSFLVKSLEAAFVLARSEAAGPESVPFLDRLEALFGPPSAGSGLAELAERIGRFFLAGERAPGVHQDCCDPSRGVWGGYLGISENDGFRFLVNARCNGEVMKAYALLYERLRERGRDVPEFIELPKRVAGFYLAHQLGGEHSGSFGRWWTPEGEPVDSLGTNGAYIVSFLIALEPYFEDRASLSAAVSRAGAYYRRVALEGDFFGDTLDADSFDKEAGAALLTLFMDLFERDGDFRWLEAAGRSAEFLLTWVWQYDCAFPAGSPLGVRSFSTLGMTSVSVAHHHLDFYGMSIAYDFLRYAERSGDRFYRTQAVRMLRACRQLVARREDPLGRDERDIGWQPEQINHTEWDYFDRPDKRAGNFGIDIAWVSVLGLGAYLRLGERYPDALEESDKR